MQKLYYRTILNKLEKQFLLKEDREKPLSDEPSIDNISKESNANTIENTTAKIILDKNP